MQALWLGVFVVVFAWSAIAPKDYLVWALEVAPAVIGVIIIIATYHRFRLTNLLYSLILLHAIVLMIGGHYTYAEVPFFDSIKPVFGFERNNYDKLGHFMQGFAPAIIAREIFIRNKIVAGSAWRNFIIVSVCLALSAFYELLEWIVAILSEETAEVFLATQGFVWDTQTDMAFALLGAVLALMTLSKLHDNQLRKQ